MVRIGGAPMSRRRETERASLRAASIGFLAQANNLFEHLSVAENIRLQAELRGAKRDDVRDLLARVGLSERGDAMPSMLSGGESARAGLAVALAADPPILLADEPTGNLDTRNSDIVLNMLRQSNRELGQTVLMITHNPQAASYGDRIIHMRDGEIVTSDRDPQWTPQMISATGRKMRVRMGP